MPLFFSDNLRAALECLLFVAGGPVSVDSLAACLGVKPGDVDELAAELQELYAREERGLQIRAVAGGYQMCTRPEFASYCEALLRPELPALSRAALETLAIIAYRQPVTRTEMEYIRGVKVDGVLNTLISRGLVQEVGRKEAPGRPILYGTTPKFLEFFGLKDLKELPPLEDVAASQENSREAGGRGSIPGHPGEE
ncbi:SMC-Scp complex subunit ScpB [Neomoorella thermoacetica]|uniref:Segregation and condensation protein B n=1 Tax=Moorella thermoacetica (strain ATCC 39073 / JCM 9320) TaxID=264732 RepID=SCPB_MOOTA|nr:SMC-Scp complex subunit ScpB [Moorella thermoacetica]Q2RIR6.1 RecName: Full=Segregation and condensation protein B [Moorella thermoacetica ATCC 39073]AKX94139.1 segregation and condensation protein B [Moorella thermoacetica]AKX96778.1 segregation and condensation protein B [Moorella thermoacetica]OIQ56507.1 segregation and condensation protein B [Moorella thermoacetica]OIQ57948.1 segregation and condensation protein B [Moorella thermoacetica]OIQ61328.1 segregation and condensation protein 